MKRKIIIAKVIQKLSKTQVDPKTVALLINDLSKSYQKNKDKDFEDQDLTGKN